MYKALTIAGFDGGGGAGMQADIKTFSALGCYAVSALTSIPIQNTCGVRGIYDISVDCIRDQIRAILDDISVDAVKIGMLQRVDIIEVVANLIREYNLKNVVLDPVMVAKSGDRLLEEDAIEAMKEELFPLATVVTPNLPEASQILGKVISQKEEMEGAAKELSYLGPKAVIVKGGHLEEDADDLLFLSEENSSIWVTHERVLTKNTHGTGCTFAAAITAFLARRFSIQAATFEAKEYLAKAIKAGAFLTIGKGNGPVHHFHDIWSH